VVRTGYRDSDEGPLPFRVTFSYFPADRNQFVMNSGDVPREPAAAHDQHFEGPAGAYGEDDGSDDYGDGTTDSSVG
jgi:hypothetical protein